VFLITVPAVRKMAKIQIAVSVVQPAQSLFAVIEA